MKRIIIGISGSTGAIYGVRMLEVLSGISDIETHLVASDAARLTIGFETDRDPDRVLGLASCAYDNRDVGAAIASGSFMTDGMVIAPCSIRTLAAVASSLNDNLLTRAADVCLKERRKLVMIVRETPLHAGHLRLMLQATESGAVILPPAPAFYHLPKTIQDVVDHTVGKALDQFGIDAALFNRWTGLPVEE
ncbi:MAG TPA: UbiX family flavin prenyltransferase [Chloroflexota bacterium]|nr:UbiX family flavin prenyltransferase [Chloroflexota bacterium]